MSNRTGMFIWILYVHANKRAEDRFLLLITSKIESVKIIRHFHFSYLIRITFDDRHSRPSLLAHSIYPVICIMYRWGGQESGFGLRQMVRREPNSGDDPSCGRRVVRDLNPRQTYRGPSTLFKSLWRGCGLHQT